MDALGSMSLADPAAAAPRGRSALSSPSADMLGRTKWQAASGFQDEVVMFEYQGRNDTTLRFPFANADEVAHYSSLYEAFSTATDLQEYRNLRYISVPEDIETYGCLSMATFERIVRWKSPRSIRHALGNKQEDVKELTSMAVRAKTDRARIAPLLGLNGIQLPQGSAIIHLLYPEVYPIIDRRAVGALGREEKAHGYDSIFGMITRQLARGPRGTTASASENLTAPFGLTPSSTK
jgi:hypothetical protein